MKKALIICLLLLFSLPVFAAEKFASPYELISYWGETEYPANVGEPYFDNDLNKVVFPLVWGDGQAILDALENPKDAAFIQGDYTHNELYRICGEIQELYASDKEYGIVSVSVGYGFSGGYGENGKMSRVVVTLKQHHFALTASLLGERYGSCVAFETEEGEVSPKPLPEPKVLRVIAREGALKWVMILSIGAAVLLLCIFYAQLIRSDRRQ